MEIVDNEGCTSDYGIKYLKEKFWFPIITKSKYQLMDKKYIELKKYLIEFYNTQPIDTHLYWMNENINGLSDSPITIKKLVFVKRVCYGCGISYEVPHLYGNIIVNMKLYTYDGYLCKGRWCECGNNCRKSELKMIKNIDHDYFSWNLYIVEKACPIPFYMEYIKMKNLHYE